jgi:hypothetical protein
MWGRLIDYHNNSNLMSPMATCGCRGLPLPKACSSRAVGVAVCSILIAVCSHSGAAELVMRDVCVEASAPPINLPCTLDGPNVGIGFSDRPFTAPRRLG